MFTRLFVPLDGSPLAEVALPAASFLAARAGAAVTLVHAIERGAPDAVHGQIHLTSAAQAENYLAAVAVRAFPPGVRIDRHVHAEPVGDVGRSLTEHAGELGAGLVVMCAHGGRRLRDRIYGSLAQQIVETGAIPVLIMLPGKSGEVAFPFRRILVPLDGAKEHEQALPQAADLALLCGSALDLLLVVPTLGALAGPHAITGSLLPGATQELLDLAAEKAVEYLAPHVERLRREGVCASAKVTRGKPAKIIAGAVAESKADLVAFGTHGKAGTRAFWAGSLASRLAHRLPASLLLAPVPGA